MRFGSSRSGPLLPVGLAAQQTTQPSPGSDRVAYIVAVVGDSAITSIALAGQWCSALPWKGASRCSQDRAQRVRQEVLDNEITELLLLQAAAKTPPSRWTTTACAAGWTSNCRSGSGRREAPRSSSRC
jgi:hypothetical protein